MIKSLLKLGVVLLVGIVAYNYFLGDEEEKAKSKAIINKTVDIGKAGVGLLKEEYGKFKDGKYDKALDKVGNLLTKAKEKGGDIVNDIKDWEDRREAWKEKKDELMAEIEGDAEKDSEDIKKKMKELEEESKALEKEGKELQEKAEKE